MPVPSDFGFHNAWRRTAGFSSSISDTPAGMIPPDDLRFLPARGAGGIPWFDQSSPPLETSGSAGASADRADLLLPVYRLKWCCILLNEFMPVDGAPPVANAALGEPQGRSITSPPLFSVSRI